MYSRVQLLSTAFLTVAVSASPLVVRDDSTVSLPFAMSLNLSGITLLERDQERAAHLIERGEQMQAYENNGTLSELPLQFSKRASSFSVTNTAVTYTANVGVGSPPTTYSLLIDTGSSNTWIGANKAYVKTSSGKATGKRVSVSYGSGRFQGYECKHRLCHSTHVFVFNESQTPTPSPFLPT